MIQIYDNWHVVEVAVSTGPAYDALCKRIDMVEWIKYNISPKQDSWYWFPNNNGDVAFRFKYEEDAIHFKMVWG